MDKGIKVIIFGTRPEFIKLWPVFREIETRNLRHKFSFIYTGQHHDYLSDFFKEFSFEPDIYLEPGSHGNSISDSYAVIFSNICIALQQIGRNNQISCIIGQGDTTSCAAAAMYAFLNHINFVHIEAGLRTYDLGQPFPEEYFRQIISISSTVHFAPTALCRENLIRQGVNSDRIIVTGNTVIDALNMLSDQSGSNDLEGFEKNTVLITCHRRENQNDNFYKLFEAVTELTVLYPELIFKWMVHKNPFVEKAISSRLLLKPDNLFFIEPVQPKVIYQFFRNTAIIITDSGGIQEEAPSFNIPVIVVRNVTERKESELMGYSVVSGIDKGKIISVFESLLNRKRKKMRNPYGKGKAARRIVNFINKNY
jgi:UDP-N-acetylglucosamine 2-epimerase (non-hydrolysing)